MNRVGLLVIVGAVLGIGVGVVIVVSGVMPVQASEQAVTTDQLFDVLVIVTGAIFGVVVTILGYAAVHFRAPHGSMEDAAPIHGLTWLEIVWTAIPTAIVIGLTAVAWWALDKNDVSDKKGALVVVVHGMKWDWKYDLPADKITGLQELYLAKGRDVRFDVVSDDVIHGFWVPAFRVQMNATPGQTNVTSATPDRLGTYDVVCTFICGDEHPKMGTEVAGAFPSKIRVVTPAQWGTWHAKLKAQAAKDAAALAANPEGAAVKVFAANSCGSCHTWKPANATGKIGPDLDGLAGDAKKAGKPLADYIHTSIVDPSAYVVPGFSDIMTKGYGDKLPAADLDTLVKGLAKAAQAG